MADIVAPADQEGTRAVLKTWLKKVGDAVSVNDPVVELETDKVAVEIAAEADGVLAEILIEEGAEVEPETVLGRISESAVQVAKARAQAAPSKQTATPARASETAALPPGIRRLLEEHGLSAGDVPASGARLSREDILAEVARRAKTPAAGVRSVPHDTMRKRIAEHMTRSLQTAPHITALFEADFTAIAAHREAHKGQFAQDRANLTYTAYFVAGSKTASKSTMTSTSASARRWARKVLSCR
jgi:2-oxoglutarate dehydrogenase E2 component (dihydrolipoamide succinyltransferase)